MAIASAPVVSSSTGGGAEPNPSAAAEGPAAHIWEETNVGHTWESAVVEDAEGRIIVQGQQDKDSLTALLRQRRKRLEQNDASLRHVRLRRDMIRYLYVILDASRWMNEKDPTLPPGTRLEVTIDLLLEFVQVYFDENPLSHLGIILVRNGEAELLSPLSSQVSPHIRALQSVMDYVTSGGGDGSTNNNGGEFSLQNGLEVAGRSLGHQPRHGSREIVVLAAALSTCDPNCHLLTDTLPRLQQAKIRVSNLALCAELYVCRKLCQETGGCCAVCLDRFQFREWLWNQTVPPPTVRRRNQNNNNNNSMEDGDDEENGTTTGTTCEMVPMGFPSRTISAIPTLVHGGASGSGSGSGSGPAAATRMTSALSRPDNIDNTSATTWLARMAYTCPQCQAKNAELPTDCAVCGLKLVLAPHLARSFHHLFPVPPFAEVIALQEDAQQPHDRHHNKNKKSKSVTSSSSSSALLPPPSSSSSSLLSSSLLPPYLQFLTDELLIDSQLDDTCCFACTRPLVNQRPNHNNNNHKNNNNKNNNNSNNNASSSVEWLRFACPECDNVFCFDCDAFLHERLHNCPGCL